MYYDANPSLAYKDRRISYQFLADHTISLNQIKYIDGILKGLESLPKSIVNLMRDKAIYLSTKPGRSLHMYQTSHNAKIVSYLGFLPGVFIENNRGQDNGISMVTRALVHEIGHLMDYTVLREQPLSTSIPTLPFDYYGAASPGLLRSLEGMRAFVFKAHPDYVQASYPLHDLYRTSYSHVTNYAESSVEEDFAEHFTYRILYQNNFKEFVQNGKTQNTHLESRFKFLIDQEKNNSNSSSPWKLIKDYKNGIYSSPEDSKSLKMKYSFMKNFLKKN